jgi:phenylacetate-CoA ligase
MINIGGGGYQLSIQLLKKLNEKTPDFVKQMMASNIRSKLINKSTFINQLKELEDYERYSLQVQEEIQFKKLRNILIYSYENVQYYTELFDKVNFDPYLFSSKDEISKIPILTKDLIVKNWDKLISKDKIDYYITHTGGSMGKPTTIALEKDSIYKEKAFIYNYWAKLGYDYKNTKIVTFRGLEFNDKISKYNPLYNEIVLSPFKLNEETIFDYIRIIDKFKPEYIHGYPSAIYSFCRLINKKSILLGCPIKGVFFISENIDKHEKEYIESCLDCKCAAFYGHTERAVFAEEFNDFYRFNNLYGYTELLNSDNGLAIVCTGFLNRKMPLIRYSTDDYVIEKSEGFEIVGHREKELLIGANNERISMAAMNVHTDEFKKIKLLQFEQFEKGKVVLNVVEDGRIEDRDIMLIKSVLNRKLKNALDIEINMVKSIPLTSRGKYTKIKQHLNVGK